MDRQFYKQLKSFLKDLILVFPDDPDIKFISTTINIAIVDDTEFNIIKEFYEIIKDHHVLLNKRNPEFFYRDFGKASSQLKLFTKLSFYWEQLSDSNKLIVWAYLIDLYNLSDLIYVTLNK